MVLIDLLRLIIGVILVVWLVGLALNFAGNLIHLLLILVAIWIIVEILRSVGLLRL